MTPTFSLVINHAPWREDRKAVLVEMIEALDVHRAPATFFLNDKDHRSGDWLHGEAKVEWELDQWQWARRQGSSHHVFLTDDLNISPHFWKILEAMVTAHPEDAIGLLCNHPAGPGLFRRGFHSYRCNSWIVGPAYVLPHDMLVGFLEWFEALPDGNEPGQKAYLNDDSSINEWITKRGPRRSWHPLPTIIEHRPDIPTTTKHPGEMNRYARERVSWRRIRAHTEEHGWSEAGLVIAPVYLADPKYWNTEAPMLSVEDAENYTLPDYNEARR
jgi:hypothetical protein